MNKLENNKDKLLLLKKPASWWRDTWREGLVSGNGIIGANVLGEKSQVLEMEKL